MKERLKKIIYNLNYYFLMKNVILFESNPDFCDNTRAVFDRMIELRWNNKYRLVWFVINKEEFSDIEIKNVYFISNKQKIRIVYYQFFSKYIIDCNRYIRKRNKKQIRIHLTHGTPLKYVKSYCDLAGDMDYLIQISDFFTSYNEKIFNIDKSEIISTGFPRNDILLNKNNKYIFYNNIKRKKTICWLPTYRNHKDHSDGKIVFPFGIPTINDITELQKLNEILKKEEILLVIKLHPAEDIRFIKKYDFSNIKLTNDKLISQKHLTIYHYLSNVDALITDYSSVYYDFLLTDKPIGLSIPDKNEYCKNNTLIFSDFENNIVGEYIYNFNDLINFIKHVSSNTDIAYKDRMIMKKKYHQFFDTNSSDRVIKIFKEMDSDQK